MSEGSIVTITLFFLGGAAWMAYNHHGWYRIAATFVNVFLFMCLVGMQAFVFGYSAGFFEGKSAELGDRPELPFNWGFFSIVLVGISITIAILYFIPTKEPKDKEPSEGG